MSLLVGAAGRFTEVISIECSKTEVCDVAEACSYRRMFLCLQDVLKQRYGDLFSKVLKRSPTLTSPIDSNVK